MHALFKRCISIAFVVAAIAGLANAEAAVQAPSTAPIGPGLTVHPVRVAIATGVGKGVTRQKRGVRSTVVRSAIRSASPSGCASANGYPAPIATLASALKCDPDLIFEYVYNNIEFEPLYGSNKGPLGTLLDRRGDDADQVQLLVALWNAAGYSQTGYYNETGSNFQLSGAAIANWLGVPNDCLAIRYVLNGGGIPFENATPTTCSAGQALTSIQVNHFVAALQLGGTSYYFDPSYKQHTLLSGISGLASILGYSQSQFLADAGGTTETYSIANVNRAQVRADLTSYANNLLNYINQNNRALTVGNVIGGKAIVPLTGSPIRVQNSSWAPTSTFPVDCPNQTPSTTECRTFLTITMPGPSPGPAIKLYTDTVYGHRITVFSSPSGIDYYVPTLLVDGAAPACVPLGTCTNVGAGEPGGTTWTMPTQVTEPNQTASTSSVCPPGSWTACASLSVAAGGDYLISTGTGQVGRGMAEYHRQLLARALAAGNSSSSEIVLGENLAVISYNWLAQFSNEQQLMDQFTQTTTLYNFGVGITAQANIQQSGYQGPYIDLPVNLVYIQPWTSNGSSITVGPYSYPAGTVSGGIADSESLSSFESAVLLQSQAALPNMTAASTAMLVDANMNTGFSGSSELTYFADGTTSAGQSYFTNTISSAISPYYNATDLAAITNLVTCTPNCGAQVLIPAKGNLAVGLWTGAGYTEINPTSSAAILIAQKISGGLSGGFGGTFDPVPSSYTVDAFGVAAEIDSLSNLFNSIPALSDPKTLEPVDSVTGAYVYTHDDLVTGGNGFPYALPFSRSYLSSSGTNLTSTVADTGMGNGWANTYSMNAKVESDPYIAMGLSDSPAINAVTSIAALYVMQNLLSTTPNPQNMTLSTMAGHWFTDQLTNNTVLVTKPNTTEEFVEQPHADASANVAYNAPPGSSVQLSQTSVGQFSYKEKSGVTLNFGGTPSGALESWVFPEGVTVNLSYIGNQLTNITNNLGRSLTLSYTGTDVTSVTDDTTRSVSYGYDGNHNLTSFDDALGSTTKFLYDTTGVYDTDGHLTQVFYPSNPTTPFVTNTYDALGRVVFQANANGYVSDFYFANSRTELVDASGNRNVTYQTDLGRVTKNAWVLNSTYGDVFNDTAQQNGVVNVWTNQYDGLGRLTQSVAPQGDCVVIAYAANLNAWANNVASITNYVTPGTNPPCYSGLPSIAQSFTYDPNWNKVTTVTDGLGLVARNSYNPTTGTLTRSIADYSANTGHLNATSTFTYNSVGQVLSATDPVGTVTEYTYDSYGNQKTITRDYGRLNQLTQLGYTALGDANSVTDPNGNVTASTYDTDRRLATVTLPVEPPSPGPLVTTYTYNPDSKLIGTQQSVNGTVERTTTTGYTVTGKPWITTDANGNNAYFAYDADDRIQSTTDGVGNVTSYVYDAMSRQTQVLNTAVQSTPLQQTAYEPDGPIASLTDANGNTTNYSYDGWNRLSVATYPAPSGGSTTTESYTYDADSNVLEFVTRRGDALSFLYDTLNRMCSKAIAASPTSCTATSSSNPTTWYNYDLTGKLVAANDNSASVVTPTTAASNDTAITYDALNHPLNVSWSPAPAQTTPTAASVTFQYAYDGDNHRVHQTATNSSWWSYPTATASKLTYNTNALNQYTCIFATTCSATFTYDGDGNLTYDGTFTYVYDAQSRLTEIENGLTVVATYAYDAQGRRKSKTVGSTTTNYVTDADDREVLEYNGTSGAQQNWYAYGLGSNDVLNQMNLAGSTRETFVPDIQGSMIATLDASSGALSNAGYQTFGENPSLTSGPFRYTAQRFDPETAGSAAEPSGLYYYRSRMYSLTLGRFMQADPSGGMNRYIYANNSPVNWVDTYGLSADSPQGSGGGSLAAAWGAVSNFANECAEECLGINFVTGSYGLRAATGELMSVCGAACDPAVYMSVQSGIPALEDIDAGAADVFSLLRAYGSVGQYAENLGAPFNTSSRVAELGESIPSGSRNYVTMSVGLAEDVNGEQQVLIGTSEPNGYLRPGVTLNSGEILVSGTGHAEENVVNYAQQNGLSLFEVGATRPICLACEVQINAAGANTVTPLKNP